MGDASETGVDKKEIKKRSLDYRALIVREIGSILGTIFLFLFFTIMIGGTWVSLASLKPLLHTAALLGVMVIGESLLIIAGEFDLSVGSVFGLGGTVFIILIAKGVPVIVSFFIVLIIAALIGLFNAIITLRGNVPSLITTLGSLFIFRGLVYFGTAGFPITLPRDKGKNFLIQALGGDFWLNNSIIWLVVLAIIITFILNKTIFGNRIFAVGGDQRSAWAQGVVVNRVKTCVFMICSVLAALGGILATAELRSGHTTLGYQMELEAIAASVVGGVLLTGGVGSVWGAVIGAFMLSMIRSGLVMMGAPAYWFITFVGIVLIIGVFANNAVFSFLRKRSNQ